MTTTESRVQALRGNPVAPTGTAGLVVLAVDDEAPALDEVTYLLRGDPRVSTVLTARDAADALRVLQPNSNNPIPEAVLLDIAMPGWDGVDLARVIANLPRPPVVAFLSAHDDRAVEAYEIGAVDYLLKPVRAARLAEAVTRLCAARDAANVQQVRGPAAGHARAGRSAAGEDDRRRSGRDHQVPAARRGVLGGGAGRLRAAAHGRRRQPSAADPVGGAAGRVGTGRVSSGCTAATWSR